MVGPSSEAHSLRSLPPCGGGSGRGVAPGEVEFVATPSPNPSPQGGGGPIRRCPPHTTPSALCRVSTLMTHPGEQFYPEGVHWDDTIVQGTLPDLLSTAAANYGPRTALEFRDRPITYTELAAMAERAAAAFLRAGCGKNTFCRAVPRQHARSSRQFLRCAEGRRPGRASLAARRRDRADAQGLQLRLAPAGHVEPRRRCCRPR